MNQDRIQSAAILAIAVVLFVSCLESCSPLPSIAASTALYERDTSAGLSDIAPVRGPVRPLRLHRDGDETECTLCHDGFAGDKTEEALKNEHADLKFNHGLNLLCLNCHHPKNSMAYVYHDGSEIPSDQPTRLCAKCHGPHYREWMIGLHGRVNKYWDPSQGDQTKLDCIQCHNPHHPRFESMAPMPPPTLTRFEKVTKEGESDGGSH
ncbi:MAG: hypothetical protein HZB26_14695 [Candidatus Hydrogenedentes bacterium]|nr:hypothetical protein [Candidatus Hydrogenedentota bacterium]